MPLTLPIALTDDHLAEVYWLSRPWFYRVFMGYGDYRGYTFFLAGLAGVGAAIFDSEQYGGREFWLASIACMVFGGLIIFFTHTSRRVKFRQMLAKLSRSPGFVTFSEQGVEYGAANARGVPRSWLDYHRAVLGPKTLLLFLPARSKRFITIPFTAITSEQRQQLLAILRQSLGLSNTKEAPIPRSRLRSNIETKG